MRSSATALLAAALATLLSPLTGCSRAPRPTAPPIGRTEPATPQPSTGDPADPAAVPAEPLPEAGPEVPAEAPPSPVVPAQPLPTAGPGEVLVPGTIRVGLLSDLESVEIPCCGGAIRDGAGKSLSVADGVVRVQPASPTVATGSYRLQVAALREQTAADALALRLAKTTGIAGDARFDAAAGLYKVRLGRWARREEADAAQRRLQVKGLSGTWVVQDGAGLTDARLRVAVGGRNYEVAGRWLAIESGTTPGITVGGTRYRGRILVYLNDRGALNVIDDVTLEDYLRGVIPKEMGPGLYGEIEALKAQAVAARTYTIRNLGDFAAEGFDICATPRCQVYGGMAVEHPLSDRAVAETANVVLLVGGQPIDALFTAVCGGHTEDVGTVFPLKADERYLAGVPCLESGLTRLAGGPAGRPLPVASQEERVQIVGMARGELRVRGRTGDRAGGVGSDVLLFRGLDGDPGLRSLASLELAPGEPARLLWSGKRLLGLQVSSRPASFDIPAYARKYQAWSRFRSTAEVSTTVRGRYPGFAFRGLEVLSRGVSGRVGRLRLLGAGEQTVTIEGLDVRWTLDLPDTWFTVQRTTRDGREGWLFTGHGWGHGVGMCQVGAYGLARRGLTYLEILRHYYRGAEAGRVVTAAG